MSSDLSSSALAEIQRIWEETVAQEGKDQQAAITRGIRDQLAGQRVQAVQREDAEKQALAQEKVEQGRAKHEAGLGAQSVSDLAATRDAQIPTPPDPSQIGRGQPTAADTSNLGGIVGGADVQRALRGGGGGQPQTGQGIDQMLQALGASGADISGISPEDLRALATTTTSSTRRNGFGIPFTTTSTNVDPSRAFTALGNQQAQQQRLDLEKQRLAQADTAAQLNFMVQLAGTFPDIDAPAARVAARAAFSPGGMTDEHLKSFGKTFVKQQLEADQRRTQLEERRQAAGERQTDRGLDLQELQIDNAFTVNNRRLSKEEFVASTDARLTNLHSDVLVGEIARAPGRERRAVLRDEVEREAIYNQITNANRQEGRADRMARLAEETQAADVSFRTLAAGQEELRLEQQGSLTRARIDEIQAGIGFRGRELSRLELDSDRNYKMAAKRFHLEERLGLRQAARDDRQLGQNDRRLDLAAQGQEFSQKLSAQEMDLMERTFNRDTGRFDKASEQEERRLADMERRTGISREELELAWVGSERDFHLRIDARAREQMQFLEHLKLSEREVAVREGTLAVGRASATAEIALAQAQLAGRPAVGGLLGLQPSFYENDDPAKVNDDVKRFNEGNWTKLDDAVTLEGVSPLDAMMLGLRTAAQTGDIMVRDSGAQLPGAASLENVLLQMSEATGDIPTSDNGAKARKQLVEWGLARNDSDSFGPTVKPIQEGGMSAWSRQVFQVYNRARDTGFMARVLEGAGIPQAQTLPPGTGAAAGAALGQIPEIRALLGPTPALGPTTPQ